MPIRDVLLAVLIVAIWGISFVVIKAGVADIPPLLLTGFRFLFAGLPLVFFIKKPATTWRYIILYGLSLGVLQFGLLFLSLKLGSTAGMSSVVMQLQAFFTIALAFYLLKEKPKRWQVIGAIVAFAGIFIMGSEKTEGAELVPFLLLIGGALFWGVANIIAKKAGQIDMFSFVIWSSLIPPVPLFALSWLFEDQAIILETVTNPTWFSMGAVFYLAYPTTVFAFAVWNVLLKRHPTSVVAPFSLLVPIFGVLGGMLILGETMSALAMLGGAVIFAGLLLNVFGERLALTVKQLFSQSRS